MASNAPFSGFSQEIFDSCEAGPTINNARQALERLQVLIEPEMKKLYAKLNGKVSQAKQRVPGGLEYTDWAWLMFTLAPLGGADSSRPGRPVGAGKLTQLTVNISNKRLYAGLCLRTYDDRNRLQVELRRPENEGILNEIVHSLSGRRWIITQVNDERWGERRARYYSVDDLRGKLLDPRLSWINSCFSRHDDIVQTQDISREIVRILSELYNLFALATELTPIVQPKPRRQPPHKLEVLIDTPSEGVTSDDEEIQNTLNLLAKIKMKEMLSAIVIRGKVDSYPVERISLPLNLRPKVSGHSSGQMRYWLDHKYTEEEVENRAHLLKELRSKLDEIAVALGKEPEFFQIMVTSPQTDSRYDKDSKRVLVNLLRYEKNRILEFWLFAIAREVAYMRYGRLSYHHVNLMRRILIAGLSRIRGVSSNTMSVN